MLSTTDILLLSGEQVCLDLWLSAFWIALLYYRQDDSCINLCFTTQLYIILPAFRETLILIQKMQGLLSRQ